MPARGHLWSLLAGASCALHGVLAQPLPGQSPAFRSAAAGGAKHAFRSFGFDSDDDWPAGKKVDISHKIKPPPGGKRKPAPPSMASGFRQQYSQQAKPPAKAAPRKAKPAAAPGKPMSAGIKPSLGLKGAPKKTAGAHEAAAALAAMNLGEIAKQQLAGLAAPGFGGPAGHAVKKAPPSVSKQRPAQPQGFARGAAAVAPQTLANQALTAKPKVTLQPTPPPSHAWLAKSSVTSKDSSGGQQVEDDAGFEVSHQEMAGPVGHQNDERQAPDNLAELKDFLKAEERTPGLGSNPVTDAAANGPAGDEEGLEDSDDAADDDDAAEEDEADDSIEAGSASTQAERELSLDERIEALRRKLSPAGGNVISQAAKPTVTPAWADRVAALQQQQQQQSRPPGAAGSYDGPGAKARQDVSAAAPQDLGKDKEMLDTNSLRLKFALDDEEEESEGDVGAEADGGAEENADRDVAAEPDAEELDTDGTELDKDAEEDGAEEADGTELEVDGTGPEVDGARAQADQAELEPKADEVETEADGAELGTDEAHQAATEEAGEAAALGSGHAGFEADEVRWEAEAAEAEADGAALEADAAQLEEAANADTGLEADAGAIDEEALQTGQQHTGATDVDATNAEEVADGTDGEEDDAIDVDADGGGLDAEEADLDDEQTATGLAVQQANGNGNGLHPTQDESDLGTGAEQLDDVMEPTGTEIAAGRIGAQAQQGADNAKASHTDAALSKFGLDAKDVAQSRSIVATSGSGHLADGGHAAPPDGMNEKLRSKMLELERLKDKFEAQFHKSEEVLKAQGSGVRTADSRINAAAAAPSTESHKLLDLDAIRKAYSQPDEQAEGGEEEEAQGEEDTEGLEGADEDSSDFGESLDMEAPAKPQATAAEATTVETRAEQKAAAPTVMRPTSWNKHEDSLSAHQKHAEDFLARMQKLEDETSASIGKSAVASTDRSAKDNLRGATPTFRLVAPLESLEAGLMQYHALVSAEALSRESDWAQLSSSIEQVLSWVEEPLPKLQHDSKSGVSVVAV